ncbi:MAG: hypothetical protein ACFE8P_02245, partial [Promethearchaeota archaeon]
MNLFDNKVVVIAVKELKKKLRTWPV